MELIKIMVNGIPGNVAVNVAKHIIKDDRFELVQESLTGPEITEDEYKIDSHSIRLIRPDVRDGLIADIQKKEGLFISIDYTHPSAVNSNAEFYCNYGLPFVMGTTGGDRKAIEETVCSSDIPAVIAPNMAKQIVAFQAMMEWCAETFPGIFKDYSLEIRESHQKGKADTSGTARAMTTYFNKFGIPFTEDQIIMERDPEKQKNEWGIPEEHLGGHGWHTYTITSNDKTVNFSFSHNINGRDIYSKGTLDAVIYLQKKINENHGGKVFTMIDVLKGI